MHLGEAASRFASVEVFEARYPVLWRRVELAPDSGGAGRFQGGLGVDASLVALDDAWVTCVVERTGFPSWGLRGGESGRPNAAMLLHADGSSSACSKATGLSVPRGAALEIASGGGGGFGPPSERDPEAIAADLTDGYITPAYAKRHYGVGAATPVGGPPADRP
jgi:N-methylhydantoinase B